MLVPVTGTGAVFTYDCGSAGAAKGLVYAGGGVVEPVLGVSAGAAGGGVWPVGAVGAGSPCEGGVVVSTGGVVGSAGGVAGSLVGAPVVVSAAVGPWSADASTTMVACWNSMLFAARMTVLPAATAVTSPVFVTVATLAFDDVQTVGVALALPRRSRSAAVSCRVAPTCSVSAVAWFGKPSDDCGSPGEVSRSAASEQAAAISAAAMKMKRREGKT